MNYYHGQNQVLADDNDESSRPHEIIQNRNSARNNLDVYQMQINTME